MHKPSTPHVTGACRAGRGPRSPLRTRLRLATLALGVLAPMWAAAAPSPPPDLDAIVTYQTRQVLASGVTRDERWQERLLRRGDLIWTERMLSAASSAARHPGTGAEHGAHKHFDFEAAARLVARGPHDETRLRYVDVAHRIVVGVPAAEYGAVGFDGRWDAAAYLVPPSVIASMRALPVRAKEPGSRWIGEHAAAWSHKVLWSDRRQVALRIESAREDGSFRRTVTVTPAPAKAAGSLPWLGVAGWEQKEYDDFMD
jgi:hypothetical protein